MLSWFYQGSNGRIMSNFNFINIPGFPEWVKRNLIFRGVIRPKTPKESKEVIPYNRKIEYITDVEKRRAMRELQSSGKITAEKYYAEIDLLLKNREEEKKNAA
jgi:hypothetical protein